MRVQFPHRVQRKITMIKKEIGKIFNTIQYEISHFNSENVLIAIHYGYYQERRYYQEKMFIFHREDGPARLCFNGQIAFPLWKTKDNEVLHADKIWYVHNKVHREDGHAIEFESKPMAWALEGEPIEEKDFERAVKIYKANKICF
jgi:hypothetical protein